MCEKPLGHRSYGHIPHLSRSKKGSGDHRCSEGHERMATVQKKLKTDVIIVQEKVDGSNCTVAKINGQIVALGKAGYKAYTSNYKMHSLFAKWVEKNWKRFNELLIEGERIIGEWLIQAHGTRYDIPHEPYIVFDIMKNGHERLKYDEFSERVGRYDFIVPHLLHLGDSISIDDIIEKLEPSGHGAIDPVEGAVWRIEKKDKVDMLVKYVRPDKIDGFYLPKRDENVENKEIWNTWNN